MSHDLLVLDAKDNVATALRALQEGECLEMEVGDSTSEIAVLEPIAFGHKVALVEIEVEQPVVKYGEIIGLATRKIARGEHVHTHNVEGLKGRGERT
ncbi:MAG: UxaA family hydrolase [Anaerolineae bacterium]|nr:UxaA family hydrolase [Anaerolineae bacterium]